MITRSIRLSALIVLLALPLASGQDQYHPGKLLRVTAEQGQVNLPTSTGSALKVPVGKRYNFMIEGERVVFQAVCWSRRQPYKSEWSENQSIEYKLHKGEILLRRSDGKSQKLLVELEGQTIDTMMPIRPGECRSVPKCK